MFTVIVVDYNSIEKTIQYFSELQCIFERETHYVLVENGDFEESRKRIFEYFEIDKYNEDVILCKNDFIEFVLVNSRGNIGYGRGNNLGVKVSKMLFHDEYYLISNNDLRIDKSFDLDIVTNIFENDKNIGLIGPKVITIENVKQSPYLKASAFQRLILTYWKMAFKKDNPHYVDKICFEGKCDFVSGCFVFIRAKAFELINGYDENIFLYGEEIVLSKRMQNHGYYTYYTEKLEVLHDHGRTVKNSFKTIKILTMGFNSMFYYFKKYEKTNVIILLLSRINFSAFKMLYLSVNLVKRRMKHEN